MITKFINFKIFLISLTIGLFIVYLTNEKPNIIYVFPTPDNYDKITYKDKANNCYKFDVNEIQCPNNKKEILTIPPQN
tara:strand:+ start:1070 stop:1303 length:234 start_codon:yes stop_codon:yes gene_type:complete